MSLTSERARELARMRKSLPELSTEDAQALAAARKTRGTGNPKKLELCKCGCGQMLGVRERRAHGERRIGGSLSKV